MAALRTFLYVRRQACNMVGVVVGLMCVHTRVTVNCGRYGCTGLAGFYCKSWQVVVTEREGRTDRPRCKCALGLALSSDPVVAVHLCIAAQLCVS